MNKEDFFIKNIKSNKIIGDDGAFIDGYVYSMDAFYEDTHFKREWMSLKQIAKKSFLVNISDAIVMNSYPKYALISISIPKHYTKSDLVELADGFKDVASEFNIEIIGGDTIKSDKLTISITIISECKNPIFRKGLKPNQLIAYTGKLGSVRKELDYLFKYNQISSNSKFITPILKPKFFYEISPFITCGMDISDGLFFELERLSKINKVGFDFFKPISKSVGCSGEEYEMLICFDKKDRDKILKIAKLHEVDLTIFGMSTHGRFKCICKPHHF
ncbi:MAG: thiamine-phosphate kinase [Campylobacterales bacterium]|nr:thiamine-phosphate kinase [Campylobacterales bacterium]